MAIQARFSENNVQRYKPGRHFDNFQVEANKALSSWWQTPMLTNQSRAYWRQRMRKHCAQVQSSGPFLAENGRGEASRPQQPTEM